MPVEDNELRTNIYYAKYVPVRYQTPTEPETTPPTTPDIWPDLPNTFDECLTDDQKFRLVLKHYCQDIELAQRVYQATTNLFIIKYMEPVW